MSEGVGEGDENAFWYPAVDSIYPSSVMPQMRPEDMIGFFVVMTGGNAAMDLAVLVVVVVDFVVARRKEVVVVDATPWNSKLVYLMMVLILVMGLPMIVLGYYWN